MISLELTVLHGGLAVRASMVSDEVAISQRQREAESVFVRRGAVAEVASEDDDR